MNILQICFRMPYPLKDGGAIAMYNLTRGLHEQGADVSLLIPITEKHDTELSELPDDVRALGHFHSTKIRSRPTMAGALTNLIFSKKPYYISRYIDQGFEEKLVQILKEKEFDYIIFESLKVSMYVDIARQYSKAKLIMRSHNVEFMIWDRMRASASFLKKAYLGNLVKRIRKYELDIINEFDGVATITQTDQEKYKSLGISKPSFTLASGIDLQKYRVDHSSTEKNSLFHLGSLDWLPNQEAVGWFIEEVWPKIKNSLPECRFYLAGRNIPSRMKKYEKAGVEVVGEVDDALDFMRSKEIMIVPLHSGSGLRIKIMEGLALGKIIISTTVGAEGIDYTDAKDILIADDVEAFLKKTTEVVHNEALRNEISWNARALIEKKYDNHLLIAEFLGWLEKC